MTDHTDARGDRLEVGQTVAYPHYNDLGFGTVRKLGADTVEVHPDLAEITRMDPGYTMPVLPSRVVIVPSKGGRR